MKYVGYWGFCHLGGSKHRLNDATHRSAGRAYTSFALVVFTIYVSANRIRIRFCAGSMCGFVNGGAMVDAEDAAGVDLTQPEPDAALSTVLL